MKIHSGAIHVLALLCVLGADRSFAEEGLVAATSTAASSSRLDFEALKEARLFPLFSPSRRPPPAPAVEPVVEVPVAVPVVAQAPPEPTPPSVELVGVVEMNGTAVALLKDNASGRTNRVWAGQSIEDWQLRMVGPRMVALAHPLASEQHILRVARP